MDMENDNKQKHITSEESYKIIDEILNKFYATDEKSEKAYIEFAKILNNAVKVKVKNKSRDQRRVDSIRAKIEAELGISLSNNDIEIIMKKDTKHIKDLKISSSSLDKIETIIDNTKTVKRTGDKSMSTVPAQTIVGNSQAETITRRWDHQRQVGNSSERVAKRLKINYRLAKLGGNHHDDGHTSNGHTGERIANMIGRIEDGVRIVHNVLGPDMLISENIIKKAVKKIRKDEPDMNEEEIEKDIWYIFDIAISHNGEGKDRLIYYNPDKTIEDIKNDKNRCYIEPGYDRKIVSASKEGALVAWEDKLCYVRTDILDGVNLGILREFNDDYLKYIGILAAKKQNRELYRLVKKIFDVEEKLENRLKELQDKIDESGINISEPDQINENTIDQIRKKAKVDPQEYVDIVNQYMNIKQLSKEVMIATTECGRVYVDSIPIERRAETVADMIKDTCEDEMVEYSMGKEYVGMPVAISKAFFGIRSQNLAQIVKYTRRKFEKELLPQAHLKIHKDLKSALVETGLIREYMSKKIEETTGKAESFELTQEERDARVKYGLSQELEIKNFRGRSNSNKFEQDELSTILKYKREYNQKYKYERKVCHYFIRLFKEQPQMLEEFLNNTLEATYYMAREDVEYALKNEEPHHSEILGKEYYAKCMQVKAEIDERYPNGFYNEDEKETYIRELTNRRRNSPDIRLATAVAQIYQAGMTDGTVIEAAKLKGYLTNKAIEDGYKRECNPEKQVLELENEWNEELKENGQIAEAIKRLLTAKGVKVQVYHKKPSSDDWTQR